MADVWSFGGGVDKVERGMPSRRQQLLLNGVAVGGIEVHAHKRKGRDRVVDLSWGVTAITYGPLTLVGEPMTRTWGALEMGAVAVVRRKGKVSTAPVNPTG